MLAALLCVLGLSERRPACLAHAALGLSMRDPVLGPLPSAALSSAEVQVVCARLHPLTLRTYTTITVQPKCLARQELLLSALNLAGACAADARLAGLAAACMQQACEGALSAGVPVPQGVVPVLLGAIDAQPDPEARLFRSPFTYP